MSGKWSDYKFSENIKVTERYRGMVVYYYYDNYFGEQRYAIVVEGAIIMNSREYPNNEIHNIAQVYRGILLQKKAG